MTRNQALRQSSDYRDKGRYAKVNPCYRCGKSAGVDYLSDRRTDMTDSCGNKWDDIALCICQRCAVYLDKLDDAAAWADVKHPNYGKHPQGKAPK